MSVLVNHHGDLRSGWRFAVYAIVFLILLVGNGAFLSLIFRDPAIFEIEAVWLGVNALTLAVPAVFSLAFMLRFVDHAPAAAFGATVHESWGRDVAAGVFVAAIMLLVYCSGAALLGGLRIEAAPLEEDLAVRLTLLVVVLSLAAANEELIFRGYPLQVLMLGIGRWPAAAVISALFGLIHHLNPNATWLGTMNTFLAGILLALAYCRTRSLWFPYGIHIGWNLAIGPIFGFPISGVLVSSAWRSEALGPAWATGGLYGPEGGVLGTAVMLVAIALVAWMPGMEVSPTLRRVLAGQRGKVPEV